MKSLSILLLSALAWCAPQSGFAAPLTLQQALLLAEQHSPVLKTALGQRHGAEAALETASAFPNPDVEFGSGRSNLLPPTNQTGRNSAIGIAQSIELPPMRAARQRAAQAGVLAGSALYDDARINLYAQVKTAFLDVRRRDSEAQLAEQGRALLSQIRNRVKLRVEVGEASRYELVKSEAETLAAESLAQSAEIRVRLARDKLRALLSAPLGDDFEIVPAPPMSPELPALSALRQELTAGQPLLRFVDAEVARAEARLEQERAMRIPQPTLRLNSERHPDVDLWRVSLAVPLPLWDRRSGQIGEAAAALERARAESERVRLSLLAELDQAYGRYQIAQRQLQTFDSGLMADAETALKVAEAAYRYGERGILDYLDAQRVFRSTRMDYLSARYELQFALIDIERLRATLLAGEVK
ncbi:MAG: TolC family protein [Nitrosomonadales bacterium]|nr:TolC family protein [Nitrosomonadales bacterium]